MLRVAAFLTLGTLSCWAAFGGSPPENAIYRGGNLTGVLANSSGMLRFPDDRAMVFETGDNSSQVQVPYARISKADLGAVSVHTPKASLYKVWVLPKRFTGRTRTQLLTVAFQGEEGQEVSMTFDLAQSAAVDVLTIIDSHTGKGTPAPPVKLTNDQVMASAPADSPKASWWGNDYWKTTSNSDKWNNIRAASTPQP